MRDIAVVGGMGTGKTTLVDALLERCPSMHVLRMSMYGARIPMTLQRTTHPDLLSLSKEEYIEAIIENESTDMLIDLSGKRQKMDEFERKVIQQYGSDIFAQIAFRVLRPDVQNIADNVIQVSNLRYFKDRGFYVVGCTCDFNTRLRRCDNRKKDIDPANWTELEEQIRRTDEFFESDRTIKLADVVYDTTRMSLVDYPRIAREVLAVTR